MSDETISGNTPLALVKSGHVAGLRRIALPQPDVFDQALACTQKTNWRMLKIRSSCLSMRPRAVIEDDPEGKHFHMFSWHFSAYDRRKHDAGLLQLVCR